MITFTKQTHVVRNSAYDHHLAQQTKILNERIAAEKELAVQQAIAAVLLRMGERSITLSASDFMWVHDYAVHVDQNSDNSVTFQISPKV